jgi:hypothetical protein
MEYVMNSLLFAYLDKKLRIALLTLATYAALC